MIITIQPISNGYAVEMIDRYEFKDHNQQEITKLVGIFAGQYFIKCGVRPIIKILPIPHTSMKTKKKVVAKKKKVVKKKK